MKRDFATCLIAQYCSDHKHIYCKAKPLFISQFLSILPPESRNKPVINNNNGSASSSAAAARGGRGSGVAAVALSASYTSTVGEELVQLIRGLHQHSEHWNPVINAHITHHLTHIDTYISGGVVGGGGGGSRRGSNDAEAEENKQQEVRDKMRVDILKLIKGRGMNIHVVMGWKAMEKGR